MIGHRDQYRQERRVACELAHWAAGIELRPHLYQFWAGWRSVGQRSAIPGVVVGPVWYVNRLCKECMAGL